MLLVGGGIRAGCRVGATDEIGEKAVETVHPDNDEYQNCVTAVYQYLIHYQHPPHPWHS